MTGNVKEKLESSQSLRKRSKIDIMASILYEAHRGAKKTRIMYRCNLSHRQLQAYLKLLMKMEFLLLERDSNPLGLFQTTSKGLKFLNAYQALKALMA